VRDIEKLIIIHSFIHYITTYVGMYSIVCTTIIVQWRKLKFYMNPYWKTGQS